MLMNYPLNETGKRIQNYVFNFSDLLGAGNFSKCYKGFNEITREIVAIKIIELNSLKSKKLQQLLFQQIDILKKLNHPSVLRCYQIFTSNRNCYIITELCNQGNLENQLKLKKTFDQIQANPIIKDVYDGLLYLAQNNIVHRDLKSANIFLHNGRAKIADFGFAKQISHNFKDLNIGSPLYMAPQGILHNVYGPKTQVWALGILVYELFHGSSPYIYCKTQQQLKRSVSIPLNWNQLRTDLSQDVKQFILTCLEINEQKRATIQQLMTTSYMRRLSQIQIPHHSSSSLSTHQLRSPSKSVHQIKTHQQSSMRNIQHRQQQQENVVIVQQAARNKISQRVGFKSMDMRANQKHHTYDFVSPRKPPILNPMVKQQQQQQEYNNSPARGQGMINSLRAPSLNFPSQKHHHHPQPQMINLITQQSVNIPTTFDHPHIFQAIDNPQTQYLNEIKNQNYPVQRNKSLQKANNFNSIGYNSMNGFYNVTNLISGGQATTENPPHIPLQHLQLLPPPQQSPHDTNQSITSWLFKSKLNFKQAIFFIHHCRLIFKFLYLYKETGYFDEEKYFRVFRYLMSLLMELKKLAQGEGIWAEGQKAGLKIRKFKQVNAEYIAKYQKQLDDNKHTAIIHPQPITPQTLTTTTNTLKQIFTKLNTQISSLRRATYLSSSEQNLLILGHLCVTIIGSLKQIQSCIAQGEFKRLVQFKEIQMVLNTKMEDFTLVSYKRYVERFVG